MIARFAAAILEQPKLLPLAAFLASGALLGGAWAFQLWGGLAPCELCLWQRYPHYAVLFLSLIFMLIGRGAPGRLLGMFALLFGLDWLASAGIAGFHVGVEQHWWQGLQACGAGGIDGNLGLDALKAQILAAPVIRCDEVPWSLFGISLAGYNLLISGGLALVAFAVSAKLHALDLDRQTA
jgi:disulfide bond formation protein DsbB